VGESARGRINALYSNLKTGFRQKFRPKYAFKMFHFSEKSQNPPPKIPLATSDWGIRTQTPVGFQRLRPLLSRPPELLLLSSVTIFWSAFLGIYYTCSKIRLSKKVFPQTRTLKHNNIFGLTRWRHFSNKSTIHFLALTFEQT